MRRSARWAGLQSAMQCLRLEDVSGTPNIPTKNLPTKVRRLKISGKFPMGLGIPPLNNIKILLASNALKIRSLSTEIGRSDASRKRGRRPPGPEHPWVGLETGA